MRIRLRFAVGGRQAGEKFVEDFSKLGNPLGSGLPDEEGIHLAVVMGHDVAHAAHLPEREAG